ncbi:hypothetical protein, partial [Archangium violaceum]|uniref:hypothetical protein n=1 Tax=Archangium violaceum TaxID=83451 RepID=UPI001F2792E2
GPGLGKGFGYLEHHWNSPGDGGSRTSFIVTDTGLGCVQTDARLCTSRVGSSVADYKFTHEIFGYCPVLKSFSM